MSIVNVKNVSHVALKAREMERQAQFYTSMIGLGQNRLDQSEE